MTILVTGANGFIGSALCARLSAERRPVREATRATVGDLGPHTNWGETLSGVNQIVHCAARAHVLAEAGADTLAEFRRVNRDGTVALAEAAVAAGVTRFVFVSSIGVNGNATMGTPFRADDQPAPHSPYAVAKWEAEQALAQIAARSGLELVIVRPPLVIGKNAKGNVGTIARLLRRGMPLPFGGITRNRRDLVSLDVLVDLLVTCIDNPAAAGQTFLVSDGKTRSTADIVRAVAAAEGTAARLVPIPASLLSLGLGVLGKKAMREQLLGDLEVDIGPTRSRLDWEPHPPAA